MIKVFFRTANHPQPLHKRPATGVRLIGDRHDRLNGQVVPDPCQRRFRRLSRQTLPPRVVRQSPPNFMFEERCPRRENAAEADEVAFCLALQRPEDVAVLAFYVDHAID